jgi:DNA-repair protein XRCC1
MFLFLPLFSPVSPDYLTGKRFFLFGKFPNNERRLLLRYIAAFNG